MCGRFTLATAPEIIAEFFELSVKPDWPPRYNIAPTQAIATIVQAGSERVFALRRWGLIPPWAKEASIGARMINARAETVASKPSFRSAFRMRRCLVIADGFYEWAKFARGKQPHYIRMADEAPFAFAGLWERWDGCGNAVESCTIITTTPNDLVRKIHDRMPVILHPQDYDRWLDLQDDDVTRREALLRPYPAERMKACAVGVRVNSPARDDPQCVAPL